MKSRYDDWMFVCILIFYLDKVDRFRGMAIKNHFMFCLSMKTLAILIKNMDKKIQRNRPEWLVILKVFQALVYLLISNHNRTNGKSYSTGTGIHWVIDERRPHLTPFGTSTPTVRRVGTELKWKVLFGRVARKWRPPQEREKKVWTKKSKMPFPMTGQLPAALVGRLIFAKAPTIYGTQNGRGQENSFVSSLAWWGRSNPSSNPVFHYVRSSRVPIQRRWTIWLRFRLLFSFVRTRFFYPVFFSIFLKANRTGFQVRSWAAPLADELYGHPMKLDRKFCSCRFTPLTRRIDVNRIERYLGKFIQHQRKI